MPVIGKRLFAVAIPSLLLGFITAGISFAAPAESHVADIERRVMETRRELLAHGGDKGAPLAESDCIFLSFWDFDGTILAGDCSEGYTVDGKVAYTGLFEECVRGGFGDVYPATDAGFVKAMGDYRRMDEEIGSWLAYPFMAQVLKGSKESDVVALAGRHFEAVQKPYVFSSSLTMMRDFEKAGVRVHIISASADPFLKGIAPKLGWDASRARGIRTRIVDGRLTERIDYPVTYAEGKTEAILDEVAGIRRQNPGKHIFILAGFGNSYGTDGPFLKYIVRQKLPAGRAVSVMVNGGAPKAGFEGEFTCVDQTAVIGDPRPVAVSR